MTNEIIESIKEQFKMYDFNEKQWESVIKPFKEALEQKDREHQEMLEKERTKPDDGFVHFKAHCSFCEEYIKPEELEVHPTTGDRIILCHKDNHLVKLMSDKH